MARKETSIDIKGLETTFLIQKKSRLQPTISGSGYYTTIKHLNSGVSFPNKALASFNSQVNPTILPGVIVSPSAPTVETNYILSETSQRLKTESGNNLTTE